MKCARCGSTMIIDGNMVRCPDCGDQISGVNKWDRKEPVIPPDELAKNRWKWH